MSVPAPVGGGLLLAPLLFAAAGFLAHGLRLYVSVRVAALPSLQPVFRVGISVVEAADEMRQ